MCTGASFAAIAAVIGAGAAVYTAATAPKPPKPQDLVAPPQTAVAPDQGTFKKRLAGAVGDPTLLTGGVKADNLTLGRSTLLGA